MAIKTEWKKSEDYDESGWQDGRSHLDQPPSKGGKAVKINMSKMSRGWWSSFRLLDTGTQYNVILKLGNKELTGSIIPLGRCNEQL